MENLNNAIARLRSRLYPEPGFGYGPILDNPSTDIKFEGADLLHELRSLADFILEGTSNKNDIKAKLKSVFKALSERTESLSVNDNFKNDCSDLQSWINEVYFEIDHHNEI
ncbi:hypothetical protein [Arenicella xantha]|uniref:Uncharacterized protein n=1 Tax=Arenicella xantha TaxID=644221 RepID=A0A395JHI9_9GAMM|nr:hypothetical protein [Arenicella xantha]RBP46605.1 hypothetical protein DFR28_1173 [Arenicella xantha]